MRRGIAVLLGLIVAGFFANAALATPTYTDPGGGYIEVCKAASTTLHGSFNFTVYDSFTASDGTPTNVVTNSISIAPGTCTAPIAVLPGPVNVVETSGTLGMGANGQTENDNLYFTTTASGVGQSSTSVGSFDGHWTYSVNVPAGGPQSAVTATFTNTLITGYVEVCKLLAPGSGLSGNWQFAIAGANSFSQTVTVAAGDCSSAIQVPAGRVKVTETGDAAENVTAITATSPGNSNAIVGPLAGPSADLPNATVVTSVNQSSDPTQQTLIKMTNDSVRLKLCKYETGLTPGLSYSFTFPTVTGNPGPNGPISPVTLTSGNSAANAVCTIVGTFRAGTTVQIVEGVTAGEKVNSIAVTPTTIGGNPSAGPTIVPGSLSLPNRTVTVVLGSGETVVTYQDDPAQTGDFKLCKAAGVNGDPVIPAGTLFPFTIAPASGGPSTSVSVPTGGCVDLGPQPFDSTWTVTEGTVTGITTTVQSITASPSPNVEVLEGTCPSGATATNQATLTNTSTATRSTNVTISECVTTELTFTNVDPPTDPGTGSTTPTGGTTGATTGTTGGTTGTGTTGTTGGTVASTTGNSGGGGSSNTGDTTNNNSSNSSTSSGSTPAASVAAAGTGLAAAVSTSTSTKSTSAQLAKALKLSKLRKELKALKTSARKLNVKLHMTAKHSKQHKKLASQITNLKAREVKISGEIALLVK